MFALKDVETQKRGIVAIPYNVGPSHTKDRQAVWKNALLVSVLPIRFTGVHYCYDDEKLESGYAQVLNKRDRAGRAIFMLMPMIRRYKTLQNRVCVYMLYAVFWY